MKQVLKATGRAVKRLGAAALALYHRYPARGNAVIASGVVFAAGTFGVVIDSGTVLRDVAIVVPIILAGEATHRTVRPLRR
jgi:hypothetical protein